MDILTLELYDVTVSEALREISRVLADHPGLPLRILTGGDEMLLHNLQRYLERAGRSAKPVREQGHWRIDATLLGGSDPAPAPRPAPPPPTLRPGLAPALPAPPPEPAAMRPLLLTRAALGSGNPGAGRRLLLGVLRELDPGVPWVGLALEATELLEDPEAATLLASLQARGTRIRVSRESLLFPDDPAGAFELIEDSLWQRLAGKGDLTII